MSLEIIFLGTSAGVPTTKRSTSSVAVLRKGELFLFDCGEGTQRQMMFAGVGFSRETYIFITHLHGDHTLGLPGLIQTMDMVGRAKPLRIFGPPGIRGFIEFTVRSVGAKPSYGLQISETSTPGSILEAKEYIVRTALAEHGSFALAYALEEKQRPGRFYPEKARALGVPEGFLWGRLQRGHNVRLKDGKIVKPEEVLGPPRRGLKIVYSGDTRPSEAIIELSKEADLLIHDGTFEGSLSEKAREEGHSTALEAAEVALKAGVKRLVLTHISARYEDTKPLLEEARKIFPNSSIAEDFLRLRLKYED
ncbi:ribonuclease Z [Candidatus Bathyarchaeota archaeon]|nr:ribonuclease Z [Candidatus Bathyarchaeota archaeon]